MLKFNLFSPKTYMYFRVLVLLTLSFVYASANAQTWRSGWVYIENVQTGLVMDVQHDVNVLV